MKHMSDLITAPSGKSGAPTRPESNGLLSETEIGQLWERMGMMYGHRWKTNYGIEDDGTWRTGLAGLTQKQIGVGLVKCLERQQKNGEEDWPPTLMEFRAMCLPERRDPIHRDALALPRPVQDPAVQVDAIKRMKEALKK